MKSLAPLPCLAVLAAVFGGCATDRVTWESIDDGNGATASGSAAPGQTARHARRVLHADDVITKGPAAGALIDRALQDFISTRVTSKGHPKTSPVWAEAWGTVLDRIAGACEIAPTARDLGAFVRARVTLEVELDRDMQRGLLLPSRLDRRVRTVLVSVDESVGELRAANAPGTLAPSPRLDEGELVLRAPLAPMVVSSPFGVRADPFSGQRRFHAGVDLDAPEGTHVFAAASGLVVYAGAQGGYGKQVVVDHGGGVRTHYSHCSEVLVSPGQTVEEGDAIAYVGSTGRSTGPHLHFAVTNEEGDFLDPTSLLDVPYSTIAQQVKLGPKNHRAAFSIKKSGDTVEISSLGSK